MDSYYDSSIDIEIDAKRVCQELVKHGNGFQGIVEFFIDNPSASNSWQAHRVLNWLGY